MVTAVVLITQRGFPSQSVTMLWSHIGHQIKISVPEFVKFLEICHTIHEGYFTNKTKEKNNENTIKADDFERP